MFCKQHTHTYQHSFIHSFSKSKHFFIEMYMLDLYNIHEQPIYHIRSDHTFIYFCTLPLGVTSFWCFTGRWGKKIKQQKKCFIQTSFRYSFPSQDSTLQSSILILFYLFFFPCTFLSHIKLKIITQMPFGYSVKYFGNLTIYYAPFFHSSFFEIYLCWKFHCVFRNTFLRGKKNLNDKESFFISLVHSHNYASHHFLIGCVVLSEAVIHLPENVLTITSAYHYQKFIRNGVNRGLRLIRVNIGKIFLSYK